LLNRLLFENSNKLDEESKKHKAEELLPEWNTNQSTFYIPIPQKLEDVRDQIHSIARLGKASVPTVRVLFR